MMEIEKKNQKSKLTPIIKQRPKISNWSVKTQHPIDCTIGATPNLNPTRNVASGPAHFFSREPLT